MAKTVLEFDRGTTNIINVAFEKDEVAASLVGCKVRFTMKEEEYDSSEDDTTAVVTKTITDGDASGNATIELIPSDTNTLTPKKYYFDVKVEDTDTRIYKIAEGVVDLDGSPTNRLTG